RPVLQGFVAIEIGVVYAPGAGGPIAFPELLLRVQEGSECDRACARLARHGRATRGRKPGERVITFTPRLPTVRMTAQIAATLASVVVAPSRAAVVKRAA